MPLYHTCTTASVGDGKKLAMVSSRALRSDCASRRRSGFSGSACTHKHECPVTRGKNHYKASCGGCHHGVTFVTPIGIIRIGNKHQRQNTTKFFVHKFTSEKHSIAKIQESRRISQCGWATYQTCVLAANSTTEQHYIKRACVITSRHSGHGSAPQFLIEFPYRPVCCGSNSTGQYLKSPSPNCLCRLHELNEAIRVTETSSPGV